MSTGHRRYDVYYGNPGKARNWHISYPPLEKGGEGGFDKTKKAERIWSCLVVHKISPDPSLPKRGIQLAPDISIIIPPLEKGEKGDLKR